MSESGGEEENTMNAARVDVSVWEDSLRIGARNRDERDEARDALDWILMVATRARRDNASKDAAAAILNADAALQAIARRAEWREETPRP